MKQMVIGLDQSYTDTGLCIAVDGVPKYAESISFEAAATKHDKRRAVLKRLEAIVKRFRSSYDICIVIEAIRLFSGSTPHISTAYLFSTCALVGAIVDFAALNDLDIYWIETRSWKKAVLGSSKPSGKKLQGVKDPKKVDSVLYAIDQGFAAIIESTVERGKNKGQKRYNDNIADAICIAVCGFNKKVRKKIDFF